MHAALGMDAGYEHGARTLQKQTCFGPHFECADWKAVG